MTRDPSAEAPADVALRARDEIERELRYRTAYLTAILNHLPQGISVFDDQLRLQYWNARLGEVLELPPDLLYRNVRFEDLIMVPAMRGEYGPGDPAEHVRKRRELALQFQPHRFERTRPNGRTHLIAGEPLYLDGRIAGFITTYTDITDRKEAERELEHRHEVLQTVLDNIPCGVSHLDAQLRLCHYNAEFRRVLDFPEELFRQAHPHLRELLRFNARRGEYGPGDPEAITEHLLERAGEHQAHSFERVRPDGTVLQVKGQPLPDGGFVTIYNDITERREAEHRQMLADKVFEHSREAIVIIDHDRRIVSVNPAYTTITGMRSADALGRTFEPAAPEDGATGEAVDAETLWTRLQRDGSFACESTGVRADGRRYPRWLSMSSVRDPHTDQLTHYIAIFSDITERKEAEAHIRHLAHHDALTGLTNRFSLYVRLDQAIADARRHQHAIAVLFLDLDRFKHINDSLGHHAGDELLVQVARRLRGAVRESDTAARLGGDEFVLVLRDVGDHDSIVRIAEKVLEELSRPYPLGGVDQVVTPSIGISRYPEDGGTVNELLRHADAAMYRAKTLGRGNFQFHSPASGIRPG
jgi:diguanylate cyclase (GGDEF)-like protein/PAS domain S-box-containing protein